MRGGFALAAKAVIIRGDKALVLRRSEKEIKKSYVNKDEPWDLPGGSVRYSESAAECLFREVREETSLQLRQRVRTLRSQLFCLIGDLRGKRSSSTCNRHFARPVESGTAPCQKSCNISLRK